MLNLKAWDWQHWALAGCGLITQAGPDVVTWATAEGLPTVVVVATRVIGVVGVLVAILKASPSQAGAEQGKTPAVKS